MSDRLLEPSYLQRPGVQRVLNSEKGRHLAQTLTAIAQLPKSTKADRIRAALLSPDGRAQPMHPGISRRDFALSLGFPGRQAIDNTIAGVERRLAETIERMDSEYQSPAERLGLDNPARVIGQAVGGRDLVRNVDTEAQQDRRTPAEQLGITTGPWTPRRPRRRNQ